MSALRILAGPKAALHLQKNGLQAKDVTAVFGASGAAKWLSIQGLDKAIFGGWIQDSRSRPLHLFGTSIGAWKSAAAATRDPAEAMDKLAAAYIAQRYTKQTTREDVAAEAERMLDAFLNKEEIEHILSAQNVHLHIGTIKSKGLLAQDHKALLALAMLQMAVMNVGGRNALTSQLERVIFSTAAQEFPINNGDRYTSKLTELNADNFRKALVASGSIPYVLPAVEDIPDTPPGLYRDGGILDYHPIPSNFSRFEGLILYPHFYPHLVPGWFDKPYKKRRGTGTQLDNVILLVPSEEFVCQLPYQRISDRKDFNRFEGKDDERERVWKICLERSQTLGQEFLDVVNSGEIAARVEPLPG